MEELVTAETELTYEFSDHSIVLQPGDMAHIPAGEDHKHRPSVVGEPQQQLRHRPQRALLAVEVDRVLPHALHVGAERVRVGPRGGRHAAARRGQQRGEHALVQAQAHGVVLLHVLVLMNYVKMWVCSRNKS